MANRFRRLSIKLLGIFGCLLTLGIGNTQAAESIVVASTTSTQNSGLFSYLLPKFTAATGIQVKVVAQGTGQALETGRRGDADVLLVHNRKAEDAFMANGYGVNRRDVMYNDFVLVGPKDDPADIKDAASVKDAFTRIANSAALFVSRGDNSGTNAAEIRFWKAAGINPKNVKGYRESGSGMGATLNMVAGMGAYTVSDRGTWLSFRNRRGLELLYAGDPAMFNPYGIILVNPARHPHVKKKAGMELIDWITSKAGQNTIAAYKINGQQLFFPNAK
jgi:tungstate transport system substrate-binding protein